MAMHIHISVYGRCVRPDKEIVADCMRLIRQLRARMKEHMGAAQHMTDLMRRILEPSQVHAHACACPWAYGHIGIWACAWHGQHGHMGTGHPRTRAPSYHPLLQVPKYLEWVQRTLLPTTPWPHPFLPSLPQVPKYLEWVERNQRSLSLYNSFVASASD